MSEIITLNGNVTADPELRFSRGGVPVLSFSIASNRRRFNRATGQWGDRPAVFYRVVCFNRLAENAAASLRRGTTVTVTGELVDDSYTPQGADAPVRRVQLEATEVGVSLRYATAEVTRNPKAEPAAAEPTPAPEPAVEEADAAA